MTSSYPTHTEFATPDGGYRRPRFARFLLVLAALGPAGLAWGYAGATSAPIVRRARVVLTGWPAGSAPITVALISDIHVAGPDMPPSRVAEIVGRINALAPDVVLIAGDFLSQKVAATRHYSMAEAIAPFAGLRPRLRTYAVLGNHDYWDDAEGARAALRKAGVRLLSNDAARVGPIVVGGIDDEFTGHDDLPRTLARLAQHGGPAVLLSHGPDPFAKLPAGARLMLAGHTHCGQVAPWPFGPIVTQSRYGRRYGCGVVRERGNTLIVTAGLGTSGLPLRIGAPPDLWLLTLKGR